ncbi:venom acid phosphatase Acph-1-like [Sitophilus oryzae]|uniref:acid phosphatase n=1 Tax=Sitophilus oryzae TaxID=7048 RepID=A0A6J2YRX6_SITOR|nr:venom acid phosphatase Acph-1-like [Sitophilus oryzae]
MKTEFFCIILALIFQVSQARYYVRNLGNGTDDEELVLVHTIFRHGNRTPESNIYDSNPYGDESYYAPYGYAQLTNEGKRTEFKIGQALKTRYESFLGDEYNINLIEARSTNVNRTKMSMLLVLTGLFPPSGDLTWMEGFNWQPIAFNYFENDKVLLGRKVCSNYKKAYKKVVKSDEIQEKLKKYTEVFDYLSEQTGQTFKLTKPKEVADLFVDLLAQQAFGYPIENWTYKYMPEMSRLNIDSYYLLANTTKLRKLSAGYLVGKFITDTEDKIATPTSPVKMYLYSAHEKNIATLLITLGVFEDVDVPAFGSYIIAEVWKINGVYGFKFFYQNYNEIDPVVKIIPGCAEFCPLDDFKNLMSQYIPDDDYCELK